jgi:gluconokinase
MKPTGFLILGVSGSGKTSLGKTLAESLGWDFFDADDFHPAENIAKMAAGIPLSDADRAPWLAALRDLLLSTLQVGRHPILACSALKESYRRQLLDGNEGVALIYLQGSYELIYQRLSERAGHYMKPEMLQSQFDTLEVPDSALTVKIQHPLEQIVCQILTHYS